MSAWPDKYVIGLTGNIATGKSVTRKMLEHLGAYSIDADTLAYQVISQRAPGYQPVIDTFGKWILAPDGKIDRQKLARLVFSDSQALGQLEDIVHPFVGQAINILAKRVKKKVIVIEAIKLLESELRGYCDVIWVTTAPPELQFQRLIHKRKMSEQEARQRMTAQSPQSEKIAAANVIIRNDGSFEDTWKQVATAWREIYPKAETGPVAVTPASKTALSVTKGRPRQAEQIAQFITRITAGSKPLDASDVMAAFGEKAFMLLEKNGQVVALAGWQVENLVTRIDELYLEPDLDKQSALTLLLAEVEAASKDLLSEAALLFQPAAAEQEKTMWAGLGYQLRAPESLGVRAWQEAARESMPAGYVLLFKQLRKDRVLKPV